jgi:integrase
MHLTIKRIDAARYTGADNARCVLWDDDPRGLGLRVFPSGHKSWVLSYRLAGRKRMMSLADYGVLTLDEARKRARSELAAMENQSVDPLTEKRRRAVEARTGTVESMYKAWIADRKPKTAGELLKIGERRVFKPFGKRGWREVLKSEVREWHKAIATLYGPYAANRALEALRAAYYWRLAQEDGNDDTKLANPAWGIEPCDEEPRQVRLAQGDWPALHAAIDAEASDEYLRALFPFILATGCRKSEALGLKWADVQLDRDPHVIFRDTKNGTNHTVPLSAFAVDLLRGLTRMRSNPHVFVGRKHGAGLTGVNKAWERIRARAGLDHITIHDLRRSFGSWLGDAGSSTKQIGAVLGHKTDITSEHYIALSDATKRNQVDKVGAMLSPPPRKRGKVVPIRGVR